MVTTAPSCLQVWRFPRAPRHPLTSSRNDQRDARYVLFPHHQAFTPSSRHRACRRVRCMTREPYPAAPREETVDILHGTPVPDPYRWLEDPAGAETEKWLLAKAELFKRGKIGK